MSSIMINRISSLVTTVWIMALSLVLWISSVFAYIAFNDSRSLTFDSGTLTLYMGQNGSSFYLDSVNITWRPLSCEIKAGTTLNLRNNCDDISFSYNGSERDIKIYVQFDNDQGTWIYNTSSRTFTSSIRWSQNVTDYTDTPSTTNGYISLSSSNSSITTNQYIDLFVRMYNSNGNTDTSNRDQVRFTVLRQSWNSYYTASSSDYYLRNTTYTFTSSDRGYATLTNYVRFYTSGTYKIRVENLYTWRTAETVVYVGNSWWSNTTTTTSFDVWVSTTNPSLHQYIDTTVTARDSNGNRSYNYVGTVRYIVEKRDNNSSFWYSASSTDYTLSTSSRYLGPSQQWYFSISNHLRFHNNGNYRLRVYDSSNSSISGTREFSIGNGSNTNTSRFELSTNRTNLDTNQYANLTIRALNSNGYTNTSYNNTVRFEVYRRSNSSSSWTNITSSSTDNNNYRISTSSYTFWSSQNGIATITNFIRFYSNSYDYMVRVYDSSNSSLYGDIVYYVRTTGNTTNNGNIYRYVGRTSPVVPELYDNIALSLSAKNSNNNTTSTTNSIRFALERKLLPSSITWTNAWVSTACRLNTTQYTFNSFDNGQAYLNNLVRCTKKGFYRVKITDMSDSNVLWYIYFTILDTNDFVTSLPGFTSTQRTQVHEEYRTFMDQVNQRETQYPNLAYNTRWNNLWRNYYVKLNALAYNKSGRLPTYAAYESTKNTFYNSFYTMR